MRGQDTDSTVPPSQDFNPQGWAWDGAFSAVTRMWKAVSSPSLLTLLFSLSDFWRETPGGHGLDHAHFCRPVYIWRSQWVPLHLLPVSAFQAPPGPGTPLLCVLLCLCGGLVSINGALCGRLAEEPVLLM